MLGRLLVAAMALALAAMPGRSLAIPLGTLVGTNGSITQGDKVFDSFAMGGLIATSPASVGDIDVQGITVAGVHGLRFTGPFSGDNLTGIELGTYHISFSATVTDTNFLFHGVSHQYVATHSGGSRNIAQNTNVQSCALAICVGPGEFDFISLNTTLIPASMKPSPVAQSDSLVLPFDVPFLRIDHDIVMVAGSVFDDPQVPTFVSFPSVDILFPQATAIPEPTTWLLLGCGLAPLVVVSRRRRGADLQGPRTCERCSCCSTLQARVDP
jgi:hypothetical protein